MKSLLISTLVLCGLSSASFARDYTMLNHHSDAGFFDDAEVTSKNIKCDVDRWDVDEFKVCKNTTRSVDQASQYMLARSGSLYAHMKNGTYCRLQSGVDEIKIAANVNDPALLYYKSGGDLYYLSLSDKSLYGNCYRTSGRLLVRNVQKYSIVKNSDTELVNVALDQSGTLHAWDYQSREVKMYGITDYQMNSCYDNAGKSYNSYVLFAQKNDGTIAKLRGKSAQMGIFSDSVYFDKVTNKAYSDIKSFKAEMNVCR